MAPDEKTKKVQVTICRKTSQHVVEHLFPKISGEVAGRRRLVDQPPILFHVAEADFEERVREGLATIASPCR